MSPLHATSSDHRLNNKSCLSATCSIPDSLGKGVSVISGAGSAPGGSSSLPFRFHIVRNRSCCTATTNCLFAPYLSIYTLVALVSYIDQNAIIECRVCVPDRDQPESNSYEPGV